ncbi:MAG: hypothetical protein ACTSPN_00725 [Promethearchaeota archaeon]
MSDQLNYSKYFPHFDEPILASIVILIMFLVGLTTGILRYKRRLFSLTSEDDTSCLDTFSERLFI